MAGVKISKLLKYKDIFDKNIEEDVDNMLIPVTLGNKTISVTMRDLLQLLDYTNVKQDEDIMNNTILINQIYNEINNRLDQLQQDYDAIHQKMIDDQNVIDTGQNEEITDIEDLLFDPWEIYGQN